MASYIPASYAGRDFATRPAAHDQLWSNDDCLTHGFSTASMSGEKLKNLFMKGREAETVTRKNGKVVNLKAIQALTKEQAETRVQEVLAARKKKKLKKKASAAVAQGGAAGNSSQVLKLKKTLANEDVRWKEYVNKQVKAQQDVDQQKQAEYQSLRDLLLSKIDRAELDAVQGAGNASGKKKKKNKRQKVILSSENKAALEKIVSDHADNVINALDEAKTHADYSKNLKQEFVNFGDAKISFYQSLPAETEKEINANAKRIEHLRVMVKKQEAKTVDEGKWNPTNFADFKTLMNEYRTKLQQINVGLMPPEQKSKVKKSLRSKRTLLVQDLLNGKRYELGAFEVMNMERG